jgi:hypothetical protein
LFFFMTYLSQRSGQKNHPTSSEPVWDEQRFLQKIL